MAMFHTDQSNSGSYCRGIAPSPDLGLKHHLHETPRLVIINAFNSSHKNTKPPGLSLIIAQRREATDPKGQAQLWVHPSAGESGSLAQVTLAVGRKSLNSLLNRKQTRLPNPSLSAVVVR